MITACEDVVKHYVGFDVNAVVIIAVASLIDITDGMYAVRAGIEARPCGMYAVRAGMEARPCGQRAVRGSNFGL